MIAPEGQLLKTYAGITCIGGCIVNVLLESPTHIWAEWHGYCFLIVKGEK